MLNELISRINAQKDFSILFAEDEEMIRRPMLALIKRICPNTIAAVDGVEAWEMYQEHKFTVVITDLMMPNMNGAQLVQHIRKQNPNQVIIVLTAYKECDVLKEAQVYGIDYLLSKPLFLGEFIEIIKEIITKMDA
ncbi:MAG: response regulator [Sulfurimonas sp.]|jgi:YesN/AraC family two-component response regulator